MEKAKQLQLYAPSNVYRVSGGSILDGTLADGDEAAGANDEGVNAPAGVVFYYFIPPGFDSTHIQLNVSNEQGELVRSFTDTADAKFVGFPGGPPPASLLPKKPGLNRFVWDQRYTTLPGVPNVFIEGSYDGHKAPPGKYIATIKMGSSTQNANVKILPDPRITATAEEYQQQHDYLSQIEARVRNIHQSVLDMRVARAQVSQLLLVIGQSPKYLEAKKAALELQQKMIAWEDAMVQNKAQSNDDIINYVNRLSADYIFLKGELDTNIPYVTDGQKGQLNALNSTWQPLRQNYDSIVQSGLATLNELCRKLGIERVMMPAE
jgi:hypothetical protein